MSRTLWIVQGLLAALFLFGGYVKLTMPAEELAAICSLPVLFVRFISVCELLGGLGLILPGILKIRTELAPLAAAGLTIITLGATGLTAALLSAFVAYGRWRLAPLSRAVRPAVAQAAH